MSDELDEHMELNQIGKGAELQLQYMAGLQFANSCLLKMMIESGAVPKETAEMVLRIALEAIENNPQGTDTHTYPLKALLKSLDPSVEMPELGS